MSEALAFSKQLRADGGESLAFREELKEKLYVPVGVDLGYSDYETAIDAFEEFMRLPEEITSQSRYKMDHRDNSTFGVSKRRVGEVNDEGRGLNQDNKNIFHFGPLIRQVMEYRLGKNLPTDARWFLSAAEDIYWAGITSMRTAFEKLDHFQAGLVGIQFNESKPLNHHLRFVTYFPREGQVLATPHIDRSVGTIAMAESEPGLWVSSDKTECDKRYVDVRKPDEGLFFLGGGWDELPRDFRFGNTDLLPTYHGVDQLIKGGKQDEVMRWAVILFGNPYELDTVPAPEATRPYKALGQEVFAHA